MTADAALAAPNLLSVRSVKRDLLVLALLSALVYGLFPAGQGLVDTQESIRTLAAREMDERGEWILPTIHGLPYVGKPPLISWAQLVVRRVRGAATVEDIDVRIVAAIAGILGVLATYLGGRILLREVDAPQNDAGWTDHAAWWGSLFLLTGPLYAREARTGHIEILLAAPTVIAAAALFRAWTSPRFAFRPLIVAALALAVAALAKGPPALVAALAASWGGAASHAAWSRDVSTDEPPALLATILAAATMATTAWLIWFVRGAEVSSRAFIGTALACAGTGLIAVLAVRVVTMPARRRAFGSALWRMNPLILLGVPVLALAGWALAIRMRHGTEALLYKGRDVSLVEVEFLTAEAPMKYLELLPWGLGVGSFAALIAAIWLLSPKSRPARIPKSWWMLAAWFVGTLLVYALLGRGTRRYVLPMWPAMALLGGVWFASALRDLPNPRRGRIVATVFVLLQAGGLTWWYGVGRVQKSTAESPRGLIAALAEDGVDVARLGSVSHFEPAYDVYAKSRVRFFVFESGESDFDYPHPPEYARDLATELSLPGAAPYVLLAPVAPRHGVEGPTPIERLEAAGLECAIIDLPVRYEIDKEVVEVVPVRVRAR